MQLYIFVSSLDQLDMYSFTMDHKMLPLLFIIFGILSISPSSSTSRTIQDVRAIQPSALKVAVVDSRLEEVGGGVTECWNALMELRSCSNEVIAFFLNGHADISSDCCKAVTTITQHCWPAMLGSLGFTIEEGNVLSSYCGHRAALSPISALSPCT